MTSGSMPTVASSRAVAAASSTTKRARGARFTGPSSVRAARSQLAFHPLEEQEPAQRGQVLQEVQQLTVPLGGRMRPERVCGEGVHENEDGEQAGRPAQLPADHDEQSGDELEDAERGRAG